MESSGNNSSGMIATDVLAPTRIIGGKYHLGKVIGEGGMGAVYTAHHPELGAQVAVKLLSDASVNNPNSLARFRREAMAMAQIRHENVISVMDAGTDESGIPFLVMELLEGEALSATLKRERLLSPGLSAWIVSEVLAGLGAAHAKNIVHRDLKPGNVFIATQSDGSRRVKLLDFGISKLGDATETLNVTAAGALVGTPNFMAPEQIRSLDLDGRVDIYAAGIMLYRMVTGTLPYLGSGAEELYRRILCAETKRPREVRPEISTELEAVIIKAMHPEREQRYPTAYDFQIALQDAVPSESFGTHRQVSRVRPASLGPQPSSTGNSGTGTMDLPAYSTAATKASQPPVPHVGPMQSAPILTEMQVPTSKPWQWIAAIVIVLCAVVGGVLTYSITRSSKQKSGGSSDTAAVATVVPAMTGEPFYLGIARHKDPEKMKAELRPLTDYLAERLQRPVEIKVIGNYEMFTDSLASGEFHMAAMSAANYVRAKREMPSLTLLATPTTRSGPTYGAYILSRANSGISTLEDLKDKTFCYTSESSSSGYLYPRAVFRQQGMDPDIDLKPRFTSDHIESLRALEKGGCDGAAVYDKAWLEASKNGLDPAAFNVIKSTERVPWDAYCVSGTVDKETQTILRDALIDLKMGSALANRVLEDNKLPFSGFLPGDDSLYDPVRSLEKYLLLEIQQSAPKHEK